MAKLKLLRTLLFAMSICAMYQGTAISARRSVVIPAGTMFRVRTTELIDVDWSQAGRRFRGALADPIMFGGDVIVPRGAEVVLVAAKVEQGGRVSGSALIQLKVDSIVVNGKSRPVVTTVVQSQAPSEGGRTARRIGGGVGLGAIIGGIAGGGRGAAIGALAGGAGGTVVSAAGQSRLRLSPETRLEFQLLADWRV